MLTVVDKKKKKKKKFAISDMPVQSDNCETSDTAVEPVEEPAKC